jgi:non-ribosomal peptide synthase protein (TIGR01720 family)
LEQAWAQISSGSDVQLAPKTTSLKVWTEAAYDFVHSHEFVEVKSFWEAALGDTSWRLPAAAYIDEAHQDSGVQSISTKLSKADSSALIQECNEPYRTQPNELLLAALLRSYQSTFGESNLTVHLEGHGRDNTEPHVLSDTVGWFTAIYPIKLSSDPSGELNSLITDVKEQNRRCKESGNWSLFVSEQLASNLIENTPNILFNYLGQFDNTFQDGSAFTIAKENKGAERAPEDRALEPIAINLYLINGELNIDCQFDSGHISAQFIARWMEVYAQQIKTIAEHCMLVSMLQSKECIITEDLGDTEDFLL